MITSLKLENFRAFPGLEISPLQRINLFAGANNTGKTGILEALFLLCINDSNKLTQLPSTFRSTVSGAPNQPSGDDYATFWQALFYDRQVHVPAVILGKDKRGQECEIRSTVNNEIQIVYRVSGNPENANPSFKVNSGAGAQGLGQTNPFATKSIVLSTRLEHPTLDADLYNQVTVLQGGEEKLLKLLQEIDPRLQKLRYAKPPGTFQPLVYAHFGLKNALSISQAGQGFSKLFSLFCQMLVSKAKILLIDEIENGLYYETLPTIWKGIATLAASEDIQVFATTHSRECIIAAHETMKEMPSYDFALHRLQRVKGKLESITHDKGMLETSIKSGLEVR